MEKIYSSPAGLLLTIFLLSCFIIAPGCATLDKEDCLTANWYQIGFEDGSKGQPASRIGSHRKACAKYSVSPDLENYLAGRDAGLKEFCTPYNGYQLGIEGRFYKDQCRGISEEAFLEAFQRGRDVYRLKQDIEKEKQSLKNLEYRLKQTKTQILALEQVLSEKCTDQEKCRKALGGIRALDNEKNMLIYEIDTKEDRISGMEDTLNDMENQNRFF